MMIYVTDIHYKPLRLSFFLPSFRTSRVPPVHSLVKREAWAHICTSQRAAVGGRDPGTPRAQTPRT